MGVEVHWMVHVGPNTCGIVLFFVKHTGSRSDSVIHGKDAVESYT